MTTALMHSMQPPGVRVGFKHCHRCNTTKPVTAFYLSRKTGRREPGCAACRRRQANDYYRLVVKPKREAA